ncbi:MAG TPA: hypothetical protein VEG44_04235 [Candidatus Acidoferrales bacterium]|nr:hypothetical protein [Candidatus Acidoferrales bacterium]
MMLDEIEAMKRDIEFRGNEIKKIAEIDWELPELRDIARGLDGIILNIENLVQITEIISKEVKNLDQRVITLENQLGSK